MGDWKSIRRGWQPAISTSLIIALALTGASDSALSQSPAREVGNSVTDLTKQLSDGDLQARRDAAWALADVGPAAAEAVPALTAAIDDEDPQVRNGALQALARIGSAAEAAVPEIFAQLRQRDSQRRYRAAFALGRTAPPDSPLFLEGLRDSAANVRASTVQAVGWMEAPPEALVDEVATLLSDADPDVAGAAQGTLQKLGARALPPLLDALAKEDAATQRRAAETLALLGSPIDGDGVARLLDLCKSDEPDVHAAALTALAKTARDDPSVPRALQEALSDAEPTVVSAALTGIITLGKAAPETVPQLVEHVDSSPELANLAATALGRLGPTALPAVPLLIQRLTPDNQSLVVPAISGLGPAAIPAVLSGAADEQLTISLAAEIVGRIGPMATVSLEQALQSSAATDRAIAAEAVGRVRRQPDTADLLMPLLEDDSPIVRAAAAAGIGQLGPLARHAQPKLRALMHDPEPAVRAQCLTAVVATGAAAEEVTPALVQGLQDDAPQVRRQSAVALGNLDQLSPEARSALIAALQDDDPLVRQRAAQTLGHDVPTAEAAAAALVAALGDAEEAVSLAAAEALTQVEQLDPSAVTALLPLLQHASVDLRRTALTALASGGEAARQAKDQLTPFQQDASAELRIAAFRTLAALAEDDEQRLHVLMAGLDDVDWTVRREMTQSLGDLGERAASAVPRLLVLMRDEQDGETATAALRRIDAAPAEAIPMLIEILQAPDSNRRHRFYALHLLRKTGPAAQSALPILRQLRDESEGRIREFYERAIRDIEP
jgi:HEAT repeat protein